MMYFSLWKSLGRSVHLTTLFFPGQACLSGLTVLCAHTFACNLMAAKSVDPDINAAFFGISSGFSLFVKVPNKGFLACKALKGLMTNAVQRVSNKQCFYAFSFN